MERSDAAAQTPIKVLYIVGWGRSGSTILDNVLGQLDGFFSTGEMHYLWDHIQEKRPCGCGISIDECPVWSKVSAAVLGDRERHGVSIPDILEWQQQVMRLRHTPRLLRTDGANLPSPLNSYVSLMSSLYPEIGRVTNSRVVIDSTKRPPDAALLRLIPNIDAYVLHLVRDPRAVAYSWQRRKQQLDRPTDMDRYGTFASSVNWLLWNAAAEWIRRHMDRSRSLLLRYEDFISSPQTWIQRIVDLAGESVEQLPVEGSVASLDKNHSVAGNPRRFDTGRVELRRDDEWRGKQSLASRSLATAISLPLLPRYRYPLLESVSGGRVLTDLD